MLSKQTATEAKTARLPCRAQFVGAAFDPESDQAMLVGLQCLLPRAALAMGYRRLAVWLCVLVAFPTDILTCLADQQPRPVSWIHPPPCESTPGATPPTCLALR